MEHNGHTINLAVVSCGWRRLQLSTMLKTAMTFSQDAALHLILFSDESSILGVACDVRSGLSYILKGFVPNVLIVILLEGFGVKMDRKCARLGFHL